MTKDVSSESAAPAAAEVMPAAAANQQEVRSPAATPAIDASKAVCQYSNFCRVTGTPEEVVLDLGLNENPTINHAEAIVVTQRVVLNYFTAKRLLHALQLTLQRHEAAFGAIEVDIQRRLTPRARG